MWILSLIPVRVKYYLILGAVFVGGVAGVYWYGGEQKARAMDARVAKKRIKNLKVAKEIENEVKALDDGDLRNRASRWVR